MLTAEQKQKIEFYLRQERSYESIASMINAAPETVRREVIIWGGRKLYSAYDSIQKVLKAQSRKGSPFTLEERRKIEKGILDGKSLSSIAVSLKRSKNGVITEVRRLGGIENYNAKKAHELAIEGREAANLKKKIRSITNDNKHRNNFRQRLDNIEMQLEILIDEIMELKNVKN